MSEKNTTSEENTVIIEVLGGLAECTQKPIGVRVIIMDHDNEKACDDYESADYLSDRLIKRRQQ